MAGDMDFMKWRKLTALISIVLVISSVVLLTVKPLNLGLDFTGGTAVEVNYAEAVDIEALRKHMANQGYEKVEVKLFGSDRTVLVQLPPDEINNNKQPNHTPIDHDSASVANKVGERVYSQLKAFKQSGDVELKRVEDVGPQVGDELRENGIIAVLISLAMMLVYVGVRFEFKFAIGAVAALFHDVIITLGLFSLLQLTFDQSVVAAVLAVIGYSLNDTIVIGDRVRENFRRMRKATPIEIVNTSIQQTLDRTVVTALTTLFVLVALALFGGESVFGFAIALLCGVLVGTYSTVYIATSILISMGISKEDFMEQKQAELVDDLP